MRVGVAMLMSIGEDVEEGVRISCDVADGGIVARFVQAVSKTSQSTSDQHKIG